MHAYHSWGSGCVARTGVVKVLTKPQHGKLTTRIVDSKVPRHRTRGATACFGKPIKAFQVDYTSRRGFRGTDSFKLEATFGSGLREIDTYTITVK